MRKKTLFRIVPLAVVVAGWIGAEAGTAQAPRPHGRGYKPNPLTQRRLHARAIARHANHVATLPKATQPTFDCRTAFNNVLPVDDQGSCGDCFMVSSFDGVSMALILAGKLPLDGSKGRLSSQYGLDYHGNWGGCNGGDEAEVIDYFKNGEGAPLTSDYGPYTAQSGRKKPTDGMTFFKIQDYGFCTPNQQQGVAGTQDMKNCMAVYGPLSVAFDAGGCDGYRWPEVMSGRGNNVDHAVLCIGWDDTKGAFLGMNQWGDWGGPNGTFWIKYGSYSWGTEAMWIKAGDIPPTPAPPVPPPPAPSPFWGWVHGILVALAALFGSVFGARWVRRPTIA